ncbi:cytochrome c550 [Planococcus versutus]|uniref:Cytochrome C n=1 Tax=Planococcus versutus TaxID=1302659 RepID=A0A1B1RX93_9BACL|nr:cytochrome c [Planococcus versutus]ANU25550.1 cytochrome C [Planococcus versutus]
MQKNAIVPYILIMAFGIGLIFFLSVQGVNNEAEIAEEQATEEGGGEEAAGGGEEAAGDFDPEATAQANCISCHGSSYEGGVGPSLVATELPQEDIENILVNGKGGMPAGLVEEANAAAMAEWVLSLE